MRISELARDSGVRVATIKYYLRERLLPEPTLTSATQAQYGHEHLERLRLIRALTGPGGLSLATTREVLAHVDRPPDSIHALLGFAHNALARRPRDVLDLAQVQALMTALGWRVDQKDVATQRQVAAALAAIDAAGFELPEGTLTRYAISMFDLAEADLASVPTESATAAVRYVVLGTVLTEPLLLGLRRLAQQEASARRFGTAPPAD